MSPSTSYRQRLQKHTRLSVKKQTGFSIRSRLPGGEVGRAWEIKGNGKNSGERGEEGKEEERHRRKERRESKGQRKLKKKINSRLALTAVAPGGEPDGKLTLH